MITLECSLLAQDLGNGHEQRTIVTELLVSNGKFTLFTLIPSLPQRNMSVVLFVHSISFRHQIATDKSQYQMLASEWW